MTTALESSDLFWFSSLYSAPGPYEDRAIIRPLHRTGTHRECWLAKSSLGKRKRSQDLNPTNSWARDVISHAHHGPPHWLSKARRWEKVQHRDSLRVWESVTMPGHTGPRAQKGPHSIHCSPSAISEFLKTFEHMAPHFHFLSDLTNIASSGRH